MPDYPRSLARPEIGAVRAFVTAASRRRGGDGTAFSPVSGPSALVAPGPGLNNTEMSNVVRSRHLAVAAALGVALIATGLGMSGTAVADTTTTTLATTTTVAPTTTTSPSTTTTVHKVTTTTVKRRPVPVLQLGSHGAMVLTLQRRLVSLGYWLGAPNGLFADSTQQAVYAFQKVASLHPDGAVGPATVRALAKAVRVRPRSTSGNLLEINLGKDLILLVRHGKLSWVFNTSTGGGYSYSVDGVTGFAATPRGVFHLYRQVNGLDISPLGQLWRPKYFDGGYAVHGSAYVPATPVSHGCVRLSYEAINWMWDTNQIPLGTTVFVY
jgi:peptidoglycan hydrolase-like protein with peptidoglycan-binding domain